MRRSNVTAVEAAHWKEFYEGGSTIEEVAWEFDVHPDTAKRWLKRLGTQMRATGQRVGVPQKNKSNAVLKEDDSAAVHVMYAGTRKAHCRRGPTRMPGRPA